jgi:hypothetical protein
MDTFKKVCGAALLALVLLAFSSSAASAQEFKQGDREVSGYVGGIFRSGSLFVVGGGYGYALRPRWQILGEFGFAGRSNVHGFDLHGDVAYLFPLKAYPKFTPYAIGGFGVVHTAVNCFGLADCSGTAAGVDFGGGARVQVGKNWGLKPEVKFLAGNHFGTRITGNVYYQFGK